MAEALAALPLDERQTVVLGLGNVLRRDEGLGIHALQRLDATYDLPDDVRLADGGVLGLGLLAEVEGASRLLVLDAVLGGGPPGQVLRLADDDVPAFIGVHAGAHDTGLSEVLALARLRGTSPDELVVLGVEPRAVELGYGLTPGLAPVVDDLVEAAVLELRRWGHRCTKRG